MRKILFLFLIFIIIPISLSAASEENTTENTAGNTSDTKKPTATLNLIMPDDTLNFGFSDTSTGTTFPSTETTVSYPKFYLWKYDILTDVSTKSHATTNPYVLAKTEFYVWYDAFVGDTVELVIVTPSTFAGSDKISSIPVATKSTAGVSDATVKVEGATLLEGGSTVKVVALDGNRIYKGSEKYCVVLDIKDAREGVTYTGEIKLKVEAGS